MMRRIYIFVAFISSVVLLANTSLYAGGLEGVRSGVTSVRSGTQKVVDKAIEPGTYEFAEKLVNLLGEAIDWYFDSLVKGADLLQMGEMSNSAVDGIGAGLTAMSVPASIDKGLDSIGELARKFWLEDFKNKVLEGTDVKVKPYFKGAFEYNSNVFLEPEAPKTRDEVLWIMTPGVSVNYPFGDKKQYRVGAVYEARITEFTKYGEHDDIGQSFGAIGNFKFTDQFYTNITEEFVQDAARAGTRSAKRVEYMDNKVTPTIGYHWRDWTFEGEYWNAIRDFESAIYRIFSYANNGFTTRAYRTLAPNFRGVVDYTFSHYDYAADETRVGHYNQFRAGVTGKLSDRTNLLARAGYQDREYRAHDTEFHIPVGDFRLTHSLTRRANLDFYFHRTTAESTFTNNRALDEKLGQISGNYLFNSKFRGRAGAAYIRHDFDREAATGAVLIKRRDHIGRVSVGVDYFFRPWLIMNLDYHYDRSNSNNSNFDYTNNQVAVGMTMPL
ncbi:MAG: outer membrane beta-barrel protein [Candidatus Omnitrophica bacterium]|nr:outer membrane beta-barrel protein [Candidatus Omnitrophota bacterium]